MAGFERERTSGTLDMKEATARIKINKLLEAAGWRFFSEPVARATCSSSRQYRLRPPISTA